MNQIARQGDQCFRETDFAGMTTMTTATTLLHMIALSACLTIQAVPGAGERPSGIRRALQTIDKQSPLRAPPFKGAATLAHS